MMIGTVMSMMSTWGPDISDLADILAERAVSKCDPVYPNVRIEVGMLSRAVKAQWTDGPSVDTLTSFLKDVTTVSCVVTIEDHEPLVSNRSVLVTERSYSHAANSAALVKLFSEKSLTMPSLKVAKSKLPPAPWGVDAYHKVREVISVKTRDRLWEILDDLINEVEEMLAPINFDGVTPPFSADPKFVALVDVVSTLAKDAESESLDDFLVWMLSGGFDLAKSCVNTLPLGAMQVQVNK